MELFTFDSFYNWMNLDVITKANVNVFVGECVRKL